MAGIPPPPATSERLDWRGVCKKCLQNLDSKELAGQNLDNKELRPFVGAVEGTASALTMVYLFPTRGKVICHIVRLRELRQPRPVDLGRVSLQGFAFGFRDLLLDSVKNILDDSVTSHCMEIEYFFSFHARPLVKTLAQ